MFRYKRNKVDEPPLFSCKSELSYQNSSQRKIFLISSFLSLALSQSLSVPPHKLIHLEKGAKVHNIDRTLAVIEDRSSKKPSVYRQAKLFSFTK